MAVSMVQMNLRIPEELKDFIIEQAYLERTSQTQLILVAFKEKYIEQLTATAKEETRAAGATS